MLPSFTCGTGNDQLIEEARRVGIVQKGAQRLLAIVFSLLTLVLVVNVSAAPLMSPLNSPPAIGSSFPISMLPIDEGAPAVAYNHRDQEFLVVWHNNRPFADDDIYAQRVSLDGHLLSWFNVTQGVPSSERANPAVAYNSTQNDYLVVYEDYSSTYGVWDVRARRVDHTGPQGDEFFIKAFTTYDEQNPSVAYNTHPMHDEFLVVFERSTQISPLDFDIQGQLVAGTAGGAPGGVELIKGPFDIAVEPGVAWNDDPDVAYNLNRNEYLVVYTRDASLGVDGTAPDIYGRRITAGGVALAVQAIDTTGMAQHQPAVAAYRLNSDHPYLVVYTDLADPVGSVFGRMVDGNGVPAVGFLNIATYYGTPEVTPDIESSEALGGYTVVWAEEAADWNIKGRRVSSFGVMEATFDISWQAPAILGCDETSPAVAGGSPLGLAVWNDSCWSANIDILGRLLGYQLHLPLIMR
jgi:hypothetical protein